MIVVTGGAGFIGSNIVAGLNQQGQSNILVVDDLQDGDKFRNLVDLSIADYQDKDAFRERIRHDDLGPIEAIFHQGACSDTTERDGRFMLDNNYQVTLELFHYAQRKKIPFIYASSAAVYGASDTFTERPCNEKPLNVYGYSKLLFDQVLRQHLAELNAPVVGLRYFNVYGPREQHKGRMASVAWHNIQQFEKQGQVKLFAGWDGYVNGGQERDFISVADVVAVNLHFLGASQAQSGVYNCGTGRAQPFNDVALAVINGMRAHRGETELSLAEAVAQNYLEYIPFPDDLKGRYQSHTQADLAQLRAAGYTADFSSVYEGVQAYVQHYLAQYT